MTNEQLKAALLSGCPIEYKGQQYKKVSAIVYRKVNKDIVALAELLDCGNNSLVYVEPHYVKEIKNDKKRKKSAVCS